MKISPGGIPNSKGGRKCIVHRCVYDMCMYIYIYICRNTGNETYPPGHALGPFRLRMKVSCGVDSVTSWMLWMSTVMGRMLALEDLDINTPINLYN